MTCKNLLWIIVLGLLVVAVLPADIQADDRTASDLFPATTLLYAELREPKQWIDAILEHPLRRRIETLEDVQRAYEQKQFLQFRAVVSVIEAQLGLPWPKILTSASAGGIAVGVDARTQGVAVLIKAENDTVHEQIVSSLIMMTRLDATNKGNPDPIKSGQYRDITAYQVGDARIATTGPWMAITNRGELGRQILDNLLDVPRDTSLSSDEQFRTAARAVHQEAAAWGYVNLSALRDAGAASGLFAGDADNPVAELLVGGILSNLQKTPFATAALVSDQNEFSVELAAPHDPSWVPEERQYFFGAGHDSAPPLLSATETILSVSAYRDISGMWLRADDLFNDRLNDQLAQADSNLSTLFSGKDFGEDILGAVEPDLQLVAARQRFEPDQPQPAIKLPAFAAVFELKDPDLMRNEMRRTFQSLIGFLNVVGAMNGQPQLDLDIEKNENTQVVTATYLPEKDDDPNRLKINFNFSPSVAFAGNKFIISSTKELAGELARDSSQFGERMGRQANTSAEADFHVLRKVLDDNRAQLVAQNMLNEGNSKAEAETEIKRLLDLLGFLRKATAQLTTSDDRIRFAFKLNLNESP